MVQLRPHPTQVFNRRIKIERRTLGPCLPLECRTSRSSCPSESLGFPKEVASWHWRLGSPCLGCALMATVPLICSAPNPIQSRGQGAGLSCPYATDEAMVLFCLLFFWLHCKAWGSFRSGIEAPTPQSGSGVVLTSRPPRKSHSVSIGGSYHDSISEEQHRLCSTRERSTSSTLTKGVSASGGFSQLPQYTERLWVRRTCSLD